MAKFILNAFSFNMVNDTALGQCDIDHTVITTEEARKWASSNEWNSGVGHADTAAIAGNVLGTDVPSNRISVALEVGDQCLIAQYRGPRLEEGASALPEGATIVWILTSIHPRAAWHGGAPYEACDGQVYVSALADEDCGPFKGPQDWTEVEEAWQDGLQEYQDEGNTLPEGIDTDTDYEELPERAQLLIDQALADVVSEMNQREASWT